MKKSIVVFSLAAIIAAGLGARCYADATAEAKQSIAAMLSHWTPDSQECGTYSSELLGELVILSDGINSTLSYEKNVEDKEGHTSLTLANAIAAIRQGGIEPQAEMTQRLEAVNENKEYHHSLVETAKAELVEILRIAATQGIKSAQELESAGRPQVKFSACDSTGNHWMMD